MKEIDIARLENIAVPVPAGINDIESMRTEIKGYIDVFFGRVKKLRYNRNVNCDGCNGGGGQTKPCGHCHGRGILEQAVGNAFFRQIRQVQCPNCGGKGKILLNACGKCGGVGKNKKENTIDFEIPKNLMTGQVYTFRGMGEEIENGHPGDLQIQVVIARHSDFKISDRDLIYEPEINILDLLLGRIVEIPYFGGYINTNIPPCSSPNTSFKVGGKNRYGIPWLWTTSK
mgnify:CR=1 FL=1